MKDLSGKIAVITGGGTGMGRELARQLVAEGCNVAICDISADTMAETKRLSESDRPPQGVRITTHIADVSDEAQILRFRDEVAEQQSTGEIHLLFNNAGIGGGGSMLTDTREQWDKTFTVCWGGVYLTTRAFLPMLQKAREARIVNTSSVNGFWASLGPNVPHTAYSAAKFAVKGFTEALMNDLKINAPHIKCSLVMPGHIGTSIVANSRKILSGGGDALTPAEIDILDGVKAGRWRILVGGDAQRLDELVRRDPEHAYDDDFFETMAAETGWQLGTGARGGGQR
jgi:NAD(P)-dependent dehydrogenase (short-subunit alcohol dehydrogenase family)